MIKRTVKRMKKTPSKRESLPKMLKKAERVFNKYIRERDSGDGIFICISCGKTLPIEKMNAGHYAPVKSSSFLRFNEYNVNGECQWSNGFDEFHLIGYRKNLINKIGIDMVDWLESNSRVTKKWTIDELKEIIEKYSM